MQIFKYTLMFVLSWVALAEARVPYAPLKAPGRVSFKENIVYQGTEATESSPAWKSIVQIQFADKEGNATACTGGILSANAILTAAHCIRDTNLEYIVVNLFRGAKIVSQKFYTKGNFLGTRNPSYELSAYDTIHDTAVIVLKEKLFEASSEYKPLAILNSTTRAKIRLADTVYVAGTGLTELELKVLSEGKLIHTTGYLTSFESEDAIEVEVTKPSGLCAGDSGSPIVMKIDNEYIIAAISSAVTPNLSDLCGTTLHGTFMSASESEWILSAIAQGLVKLKN
ncbi:trypsin-like serine protease [Bdellovibrio bacteriovorus]|nr:trypsin-like serine protease [Bdellovibrio bacteriovorus]